MDEFACWCAELREDAEPPPGGLARPTVDECRELLALLGVADPDADEVIATWPSPRRDRELWWLFERAYGRLVAGLDPDPEPRAPERWPLPPASFGAMAWQFYVHLFLAATPALLQWHGRHGVDAAVSQATLADVGRQVARHRDRHGFWGLEDPQWLVNHYRGRLFALGRVQFKRERVEWSPADCAGAGAPFGPGDPVLGIHIPAGGSLAPESVAASFRHAREFFARCFPGDDCAYGIGVSWMFDPTLATWLAPGSNIMRFAGLFRLVPEPGEPGDDVMVATAFGRADHPIVPAPGQTTLQRAVVGHLAGGGQWRIRRGWCEIHP